MTDTRSDYKRGYSDAVLGEPKQTPGTFMYEAGYADGLEAITREHHTNGDCNDLINTDD